MKKILDNKDNFIAETNNLLQTFNLYKTSLDSHFNQNLTDKTIEKDLIEKNILFGTYNETLLYLKNEYIKQTDEKSRNEHF